MFLLRWVVLPVTSQTSFFQNVVTSAKIANLRQDNLLVRSSSGIIGFTFTPHQTDAILVFTMTLLSTRNIVIFAILSLSVVLTARALLHSRILVPESTFELIPDNVDLTLKNITYTKTRDGEPLWTLVANSAAHSTEEGITRIEDVRMVFFDRKGGDMRLTADRGHGRMMADDVFFCMPLSMRPILPDSSGWFSWSTLCSS